LEAAPIPTTRQTTPTPATGSSFLSELAMLDDDENAYAQEQEKSEYEHYVLLGQGGSGKADELLKWWKVHCSIVSYIFILTNI